MDEKDVNLPETERGWGWVELTENASPNGYKIVGMSSGMFLKAQDVEYESERLNGYYYVTAYITVDGEDKTRKKKLQFSNGDSKIMKLTDKTQTLDMVRKVGVSIQT